MYFNILERFIVYYFKRFFCKGHRARHLAAMSQNMLLNIFVLSIIIFLVKENAAKNLLRSPLEIFRYGYSVNSRYSGLGSCLRGGGDTANLTEKVFRVLQMREAAISATNRQCNCSAGQMTVPSPVAVIIHGKQFSKISLLTVFSLS
jgi:hypothetical protein